MKKAAIISPDWLNKNAIYQINPRTFSKEGTINAITEELPFLKELGFNIMYLCPIFEEDDSMENHSPRQISSKTGNPKNPYRMNDYFSIDEEYGTMEDLKSFVKKAHELEMKVLLDLVYMHIGKSAPIVCRHPEFVKQDQNGENICTRYNFLSLDFKCDGLREYLYCNMIYYISVIDVDGFRCDVGDAVPIDFWNEAKKRIQTIKPDSVLINEGSKYDYMETSFDACYCFEWHNVLRGVFCDDQSAAELKKLYEELNLPAGAKLLRDIDNHDTVTDWRKGRTEMLAGHDGMEQIEVINYLIDGIPMVYTGNELACNAKLNMFANRFYPGDYEFTDRNNKKSTESVRRQKVFSILNKIKSESDVLYTGKTVWIENSAPESVISFKRVLNDKEILFVGNAKKCEVDVKIDISKDKELILTNGKNESITGGLHLGPCEYAVYM